jgi:hypothetical protein
MEKEKKRTHCHGDEEQARNKAKRDHKLAETPALIDQPLLACMFVLIERC